MAKHRPNIIFNSNCTIDNDCCPKRSLYSFESNERSYLKRVDWVYGTWNGTLLLIQSKIIF